MTNKTSTPTRKTGTSDELLRAYTIPDAAERLSMDEDIDIEFEPIELGLKVHEL